MTQQKTAKAVVASLSANEGYNKNLLEGLYENVVNAGKISVSDFDNLVNADRDRLYKDSMFQTALNTSVKTVVNGKTVEKPVLQVLRTAWGLNIYMQDLPASVVFSGKQFQNPKKRLHDVLCKHLHGVFAEVTPDGEKISKTFWNACEHRPNGKKVRYCKLFFISPLFNLAYSYCGEHKKVNGKTAITQKLYGGTMAKASK